MKPEDTSIFNSSLTLEENIDISKNSLHKEAENIITEIESLTNNITELKEKKNEITSKLNDPINLVFDYFDFLSEDLKQREKDIKSLDLIKKDKDSFIKNIFSKKSVPEEEKVKERLKKKINVNCYTLTEDIGNNLIDLYLYTPITSSDIEEKNILGRLYLSFLEIAKSIGRGAGLEERYVAFKFRRPAGDLKYLIASLEDNINNQWSEIKDIYNLDITLSGKGIFEKVVSKIIEVPKKIPGKRGRKKSELRIKYEEFLKTGIWGDEGKAYEGTTIMKDHDWTQQKLGGFTRVNKIKPLAKIQGISIYPAKPFDDYFKRIEQEPDEIVSKQIKEKKKKEIEQYIPKGQISLFKYKKKRGRQKGKTLFDEILRTGMYPGKDEEIRVYFLWEIKDKLGARDSYKTSSKIRKVGINRIMELVFTNINGKTAAASIYPADEFDEYIELLKFKNQLKFYEIQRDDIKEAKGEVLGIKVISTTKEEKKIIEKEPGEIVSEPTKQEEKEEIEQYIDKKYLTGDEDVDSIIKNGFPVKNVRKQVYVIEQIKDLIFKQFGDELSENDLEKWIKFNEISLLKDYNTLFYDSDQIDQAIISTDFERFIKGHEWKKSGNIKLIKEKITPQEWKRRVEEAKKKPRYTSSISDKIFGDLGDTK